MSKKEYLVQVTIVEARGLQGKNYSGTSDPFVKITCANCPSQVTTTKLDVTSATWNQSFTFTNVQMSDLALKLYELFFECFDYNAFMPNSIIGSCSIGLSTLHQHMNHEFYNSWLTLVHPDHPTTPQGYLLVSCFIIGPNDVPPVHGEEDEQLHFEEVEGDDNINLDELTKEQKLAMNQRRQGLYVLGVPNIVQKSFQLAVNLFRAENMCSVDVTGNCDLFISVRVQGIVQKTRTIEGSFNPTFMTTLLYPIYFPVLNDLIKVTLWSKRRNRTDVYVGTIPEYTTEILDTTVFNITKLQSAGGNVAPRWFHIYGTPPRNRPFRKKEKEDPGKANLGKVLASLNLIRHDKPQLGMLLCSSQKDPNKGNYVMWVDIFELSEPKGVGSYIWIEAQIENHIFVSEKAYPSRVNKDLYQWPVNKQSIPFKNITVPLDITQVADSFINLYTKGMLGGRKCLGYFRCRAQDCNDPESIPEWRRFIHIHGSNHESPGNLLCNIQFLQNSDNLVRMPKKTPLLAKFTFHGKIYSGFELDPFANNDNTLCSSVEVKIGNEILETPRLIGAYPIWNHKMEVRRLEFENTLQFSPNLQVSVIKHYKKLKFMDVHEKLGEFSVPLCSLKEIPEKPQFFNLISHGKIQGRILAKFYLGFEDDRDSLHRFDLDDLHQETHNVDLQISVLGVRFLNNKARDPTIEFQLTNTEEVQIMHPAEEVVIESHHTGINPNFMEIISFEDITLDKDPLLWPLLEIRFKDHSFFGSKSFNTILSLINFAEDLISERERAQAMKILNFRDSSVEVEQRQIPTLDIKVIDEEEEEEEEDGEQSSESDRGLGGDDDDEIKDNESIKSDSGSELEDDALMIINKTGGAKTNRAALLDHEFDISEEIKIDCTESNVKEFIMKKEKKEKKLNEEKEKLDNELNKAKKKRKKKQLTKQIREINEKLNHLVGEVDENYFRGFADEEQGNYNYGREKLKDDTFEKDCLVLPYGRIPLFLRSVYGGRYPTPESAMKNAKKDYSGVILKAKITLSCGGTLREREIPLFVEKEQNELGKKEDFETNVLDEAFISYPFDLLTKKFYETMAENGKRLHVRPYCLRGLNLSATDSSIELKPYLAGMSAKCSADPYMELIVGDGNDTPNLKKRINDRIWHLNGTLNPVFKKHFDLDLSLPSDLLLVIKMWDYSKFGSNLIGETSIDLEDRYFGDLWQQELLALSTYKQIYNKAKKELQKTHEEQDSKEDSQKMKNLKKHLNQINNYIMNLNHMKPKNKIEYRKLMHKKKKPPQGMIELWVDIYPPRMAEKFNAIQMEEDQTQSYEIRLIIWEASCVPLGNRDAIDLYLCVTFDITDWTKESQSKDTDVHFGSKDGSGVWNYRMKFRFNLPGEPRLTFCMKDFDTFGVDESIGECSLTLRRLCTIAENEGKVETDKTWLSFKHSNFPGEQRGLVLVSFSLLPTAIADMSPVGEKQEDPNVDPVLEKPKTGRGFKAYMSGTILDTSGFSLPLFGLFKNLAILGVAASFVFILVLIVKFA